LEFPATLDRRRYGRDGIRDATRSRCAPKSAEFAIIKTHVSISFGRTRDDGTPYAVDVAGGGRNSAMSRKMSEKMILGMAISAI
jgi:hypothetical protein